MTVSTADGQIFVKVADDEIRIPVDDNYPREC